MANHLTLAEKAEIQKYVDSLNPTALVRVKTVAAYIDCTECTVWNWVKKGKFPAPKKLTAGFTAWRVGDVREFLQGAAA